jgi:hypothetical protein
MQGTIYICPDCTSDKVWVLAWRDANTGLLAAGDPDNHYCNHCRHNQKRLNPTEGETSGSIDKLVTDLSVSGLFEFVLEGHEIPAEIRAEWEGLHARLKALTAD